jgi:hypothetical protein
MGWRTAVNPNGPHPCNPSGSAPEEAAQGEVAPGEGAPGVPPPPLTLMGLQQLYRIGGASPIALYSLF